jgi:hypothetical protein
LLAEASCRYILETTLMAEASLLVQTRENQAYKACSRELGQTTHTRIKTHQVRMVKLALPWFGRAFVTACATAAAFAEPVLAPELAMAEAAALALPLPRALATADALADAPPPGATVGAGVGGGGDGGGGEGGGGDATFALNPAHHSNLHVCAYG